MKNVSSAGVPGSSKQFMIEAAIENPGTVVATGNSIA
tara:strand:- start:2846 stop:2956 length:111 start_codon:yes stop_codon:yes gene_type:complete